MSGFSLEQRRLLQGMGYTLLQRVGASAPAETNAMAGASRAAEPEPTRATPAAHPLWTQILRALGGPAERAGLFEVESGPALQFDGPRLGINLMALREDPAAKRRLWQTLRDLRPDP